MSTQNKKASKILPIIYILAVLHLFIGLNASISGVMLMLQPDGSLMRIHPDWLYGSPFHNYFIPGLLLFLFLGLVSFVVMYGLFQHPSKWFAFKIYPTAHWGWFTSLAQGAVILLWIVAQIILTHYFWLQPAIIFIALFIILLTLSKKVVNFYAVNRFRQE